MSKVSFQKLGDVADIKLSNVDKKINENERLVRLCNYTDVYKNAFINSDKAKDFMVASCNENEIEKFILKRGQVVITKDSETRNDIGVSTYIAEDFDDVILGYHLALITPYNDKLSGRFLHYWLNSKQAKTYFENNAGGSGQRCTLPIDIIKSITLNLPNLPTQQKIASVLSALDDKIELNNKINAELEQMAKTIYDYWFVQFDFPDKNGRPYKSSGGKMLYNETLKRKIPEGWNAQAMSDLGTIIGGSTPSKLIEDNFIKDGMPWITPKDLSMNTGNKFISKGENDVSDKGLKEASLNILAPYSVLMSSRAPIGYLAINRVNCTTNQGFKSIVCNKEYSCEYVYYVLNQNMPTIEANATGSTFKEISSSILKSIKIIKPTIQNIDKFVKKVKPIFEKQDNLEQQNQQLSTLRDWLLPMLMNGQVSVKG